MSSVIESVLAPGALTTRFPWYADPSFSVMSLDGDLLATSHPAESASLTSCGQALLRLTSTGDAAITNDPAVGSPHVTVFTVLVHGEKAATLVRARVADVGGFEMGGFAPQSFDTWGEGVRFSPIRLRANGATVRHVPELLAVNSRAPKTLLAEVDAMLSAADAIADAISTEQLSALASERAAAQSAARSAFVDWATTPVTERGAVSSGSQHDELLPQLQLTVEVAGDTLRCDLSGSDAQEEGPYNCPLPVATDAVAVALSDITGVPLSPGVFSALSISAAPGLVLSAEPPASTALAKNITSVALYDAARRAFAALAGIDVQSTPNSSWREARTAEHDALVAANNRMRLDIIEQIKAQELSMEQHEDLQETHRG